MIEGTFKSSLTFTTKHTLLFLETDKKLTTISNLGSFFLNQSIAVKSTIISKPSFFSSSTFSKYSFGGGVANDAIVHFANDNLPFRGVGNSGMGEYHGKYSFKIFSHYKPIVKRSFLFDLPQRNAPYPKSLSFLKFLINRL